MTARLDSFTATGAKRLADTIRAYWQARGHTVGTRCEMFHSGRRHRPDWLHAVRSDLVNGLPPSGPPQGEAS